MNDRGGFLSRFAAPARWVCTKCGNEHGTEPAVVAMPEATPDQSATLLAAMGQMAGAVGLAPGQVPTILTPSTLRTFLADVADASRALVATTAKDRCADRLRLTREAMALGDAAAASTQFEMLLDLLSNDGTGVELR